MRLSDQAGWRGLAIAVLGLSQSLILWQGSSGDAAQQLLGVGAASLVGWLTLLWLAIDTTLDKLPVALVVVLGIAVRVIAAGATPLLEDDHFRYLWDGMRTATALDPYRLPPSAFFGSGSLGRAWQDVLSGINNPDIKTIYGPVLQFVFAAGYAVAPVRVGAIQAILVAFDLVALGVLVVQHVPVRWLAMYALHPLILKEAMSSAHPDALVGLLVLLATVAWRDGKAVLMGVILGTAIATKASALIVAPVLCLLGPCTEARRGRQWALVATLAVVVSAAAWYLPFILKGAGSDRAGLTVFANQWRFNPLGFRILSLLAPQQVLRQVAACLVVASLAFVAWRWRARRCVEGAAPPPSDFLFVGLLLFSPVVNPWYWLWALAPAALLRHPTVPAMAAIATVSYWNSSILASAGVIPETALPFHVSWSLTAAQFIVLVCALVFEFLQQRASYKTPAAPGVTGHPP